MITGRTEGAGEGGGVCLSGHCGSHLYAEWVMPTLMSMLSLRGHEFQCMGGIYLFRHAYMGSGENYFCPLYF